MSRKKTGKIINCIVCEKEKYYPLSDIKIGARFCSKSCGAKARIYSDKTKLKMSQAQKGRKHSEETKIKLSKLHTGRIGYWSGKKHSEMTKNKMRKSQIGKKHPWVLRGEKHHWWKGGKTTLSKLIRELDEYVLWRKTIFKQDNYTCIKCNKKGIRLEANHKKAFNIILQKFLQTYSQFSPIEDKETLARLAITYAPFWDLRNGETMCKDCHKETDNYGRPKLISINGKKGE